MFTDGALAVNLLTVTTVMIWLIALNEKENRNKIEIEIPLCRPPKLNSTSMFMTSLVKQRELFLHFYPIVFLKEDHSWKSPKVACKATSGQCQR